MKAHGQHDVIFHMAVCIRVLTFSNNATRFSAVKLHLLVYGSPGSLLRWSSVSLHCAVCWFLTDLDAYRNLGGTCAELEQILSGSDSIFSEP